MLGMLINTRDFMVKAPEKKIDAAAQAIRAILGPSGQGSKFPTSLRALQRVTGLLMSMVLALPAVRVFTREIYRCIALAEEQREMDRARGMGVQARDWVHLAPGALEELAFWLPRLQSHNGLPIDSRETQVEVLLWSDASDVGWGGEAVGVTVEQSGGQPAQLPEPSYPVEHMVYGELPKAEIANSSTRRELVGLLHLATTPKVLAQIRGRRIKVLMDSVPALRNLINGGGPVPNLTEAVKEWTRFCEREGIQPVYDWVPRAANWRADKASKLFHAQHTFRSEAVEKRVRDELQALVGDAWRGRHNHWLGRVPLFTPMFHQVDARVEMIRATLEEAIIVVPQWPAGGATDWFRRIKEHSLAQVCVGYAREVYAEATASGHDEKLLAFWMLGRRGERRREQKPSASVQH